MNTGRSGPIGSIEDPLCSAERSYGHILVCLDGSKTSERTLPLAAHLAMMARGRLTLLRVLESPVERKPAHAVDAISWQATQLEARSYLEAIVEGLIAQDIPAACHLAEGAAASEIGTWADVLGADLVVLSSHGEGAADQDSSWPLGST